MNILLRPAFLAAALAIPAPAEEKLPEFTLTDLKLGTTLRGDEVKAEDLKGKVVVVEYWGVT